MKLSAAILFAAANAQRDGRVRDKDTDAAAAAYDSYNAGFGGDDAYGGFYDAFADAFGDAGAYGYEAYDATAAPAVEDAGRPVETVEEDADAGKTLDVDVVSINTDPHSSTFNQYCFVGVGNSASNWFDSGAWQNCAGEHQACEIKVVRRFNKADGSNPITQIQSKCANEASCVDNMKQNFAPAKNVETNIYSMYGAQSCRPMNLAGITQATVGARFKVNDSTCFFCIEPCSSGTVYTDGATAEADLTTNQCVGKSGGFTNSAPSSAVAIDLFTEAGLDLDPVDAAGTGTDTRDIMSNNYYSTVTVNVNGPQGSEGHREISKIQYRQLLTSNAGLVGQATVSA